MSCLSKQLSALLVVVAFASVSRAGVVYFKVAEIAGRQTHYDSFVLPLTDPQQIDHARDLIRDGPEAAGGSIVFAHVAPGADGLNRDLNAPGVPAWDWHVTTVDGFGDFGIELTDGWPTFVQQDVAGWITNTNGQIGFWSYTVVAELSGPPSGSPGPAVPLPPALPAAAVLAAAGGVAAVRRRRRLGPG